MQEVAPGEVLDPDVEEVRYGHALFMYKYSFHVG